MFYISQLNIYIIYWIRFTGNFVKETTNKARFHSSDFKWFEVPQRMKQVRTTFFSSPHPQIPKMASSMGQEISAQ